MTFLETSFEPTDEIFDGAAPAAARAVQPGARLTALIRSVAQSINKCELTYRDRQRIDYQKACAQLEEYQRVLGTLNVDLIRVPASEAYPDCCFVQDTAVVLDEICIIASMGAASRVGETRLIEELLSSHRPIERVLAPATLDGGDVVQIGKRLFVGASKRTNARGIARLIELAEPFGYSVVPVSVNGGLHLTTGCGIVNDETVIVNPRWLDATAFKGLRVLHVAEDEPWAANTVRVDPTVCVERGAAKTIDQIQPYVRNVATLDISEFRKAEGSLSCLSLIFNNSSH